MAATIVERVVVDQPLFASWMWDHMIPMSFLNMEQSMAGDIVKKILSLQMLSAVVVGAVLIVIAIWLRGKADEI